MSIQNFAAGIGQCEISRKQVFEGTLSVLFAAEKPVAFVCHAPAGLRHVKTALGTPLE